MRLFSFITRYIWLKFQNHNVPNKQICFIILLQLIYLPFPPTHSIISMDTINRRIVFIWQYKKYRRNIFFCRSKNLSNISFTFDGFNTFVRYSHETFLATHEMWFSINATLCSRRAQVSKSARVQPQLLARRLVLKFHGHFTALPRSTRGTNVLWQI